MFYVVVGGDRAVVMVESASRRSAEAYQQSSPGGMQAGWARIFGRRVERSSATTFTASVKRSRTTRQKCVPALAHAAKHITLHLQALQLEETRRNTTFVAQTTQQHSTMAKLTITALLATSTTALVPPVTRIASHKLRAVDEATALLEQAAALRAEADALAAEAMPPAPAPPPPAPVAVAEPVVEAKELTPEEKTQREIENRKKITEALRAATKARNKEQIQIALATAEKAGGFSRDNLDIIAAVQAFNELNELSDEVRNKLVADMRKSDPMSADYQGGGNLYLGIFGLMTVLVIAGGKGIFY